MNKANLKNEDQHPTSAGKEKTAVSEEATSTDTSSITETTSEAADDLSSPPDDLNGLIDPETHIPSHLIREEDLKIARNLRRLEVHRFEIAAALQTITDAEIGPIHDEEEQEIELSEADQQHAAYLAGRNQRRQQKQQARRKNQFSYHYIRLKAALLRQLGPSKPASHKRNQGTANLSTKNSIYQKWHKWRHDQKIEQRLARPEASLKTPTIPPLFDQEASAQSDAKIEHQIEQHQATSLCAPVQMVDWSIKKLSNYQEGNSFRHFLFIDPRAGHGRTALTAANYDFRSIWAIEAQQERAEAASQNIAHDPNNPLKSSQIELINSTLSEEQFPPLPTLIHIFTPPSKAWLTSFLATISTSFYQSPRQIYVVMINNPFKDAFDQHPNLQHFTPPTGTLEQATLLHPYEIEFYHSILPSQT